jgi:hypothetical protein
MGILDAPFPAQRYRAALIHDGTSYPSRPAATRAVEWIGPTAPADADEGDYWTPIAAAKPVIFDTDWWTDSSDVTGLRAATNCERRGLIDIRAVVLNCTLNTGPASVDALMTYDGHPQCPIGKSSTSHIPDGSPPFQSNMQQNFPHNTGLQSLVPSALTVMRQVLADATEPVDIVSVGYCNNLQDLMNSTADGISSLTGMQLIAQKVGTLWLCAGQYPTGSENNFNRTTLAKTSGNDVCANWPGPIVYSGFEIGEYIMSGGNLRTLAATDPVATGLIDQGAHYGRPSWDALCVYMCAVGTTAAGYTTVAGSNAVNSSTGANTFTAASGGKDFYVVKARTDEWYAEIMAELMAPVADWTTSVPGQQILRDEKWQSADHTTRKIGAVSVRSEGSDATLIGHWHAADLSDWNNGSAIGHWPDRGNRHTLRQQTAARRPSYYTSVGGKSAVFFNSAHHMFTDYMVTPRDFTVYAHIYLPSLPSAQQAFCSWDALNIGGSFTPKAGRMVISAANRAAAIRFANITGYTDTAAAALSATTWTKIAMRFGSINNKIEIIVDGTATGGTTVHTLGTYANAGLWIPFNVGCRYFDSYNVETINAYLREMRLYNVRHSDAEVAATLSAIS